MSPALILLSLLLSSTHATAISCPSSSDAIPAIWACEIAIRQIPLINPFNLQTKIQLPSTFSAGNCAVTVEREGETSIHIMDTASAARLWENVAALAGKIVNKCFKGPGKTGMGNAVGMTWRTGEGTLFRYQVVVKGVGSGKTGGVEAVQRRTGWD